ncbi:hypothetical protein XANCAGTX0491_003289 [Xanthoria calcicola]
MDSERTAISGCMTFSATAGQGTKRKRAKFGDLKRRDEVAQVRSKGACMKCRWKKLPCSGIRPCMSCISSWVSLDPRSSKLSWMNCVSASWNSVNIYSFDKPDLDYSAAMRACSVLLEEPTELRFDGDVQWDVHALSADFTTWMTDEDGLTTATSRVGILSDTEFQQILQQYLADDVCMHLRLLVKISTLLYNRQENPHPRLTPHQLIQMRSTIGIRLLQSLEAALKRTALQAASKDKLEGLFLVVVGVIIATKYTSMNGHEEARHELLRVLAHYMVLIGDRIGLLHCLTTKRRLVENCHNLWNKPGNFAWNYGSSSTKEISDPLPQLDAGLPFAYDWLPDVWPDNSNLMTAVGTTKCGFCNANIPSDDICQVCFGPNLLMAGGEDAKLQADRGCTSPILDPDASDPEATFMEATSEYGASEPWQTESSVSNNQSRTPHSLQRTSNGRSSA